ncbi:N-6 DNA methylase [Erythrobacter sp. SD-21]|uniref:Eco57I restriction-modification methylase domain-containing protein n=1 Tax=Erythrobacter sp. SD-21 TaxID=161528 RepID=UPI000A05397C|nr:N-6 DNA methylase [Erythrobacter sp. SD-21]
MPAPKIIKELCARFELHREAYKASTYNETQVRREFIDPFLKALGWDIDNEQGYAEAYKDVVHEDALKIGGNTKAPDYGFRIGGTRKFFLEAKKPAINLKEDISPAFQLRRYAWSAKLPLSILTDFEEFAVYDCRIKPESADKASMARIKYYTFDDYVEKWDEIAGIFSRDAVLKGSFDKYATDNRRKRGTAEVDDAFLEEIEGWRAILARNIALRNRNLNVRELNSAVQKTIDRIVFLRIAEDRGIENYGQLQSISERKDIYSSLAELFRKADDRYNSGLFHFFKTDGSSETLDNFTLELSLDDKALRPILRSLYYPRSPYEFSVLPADILGQVYERFLGKVIRLAGSRAVIEEKPEVKKAGGVYYTPAYIVSHIVATALGPLLEGKTPAQASGDDKRTKAQDPIRVIDPACGSGSFLIVAYQYLLDWYRSKYISDDPLKYTGGKDPKLVQVAQGDWRLTIAERRRILLTHIYGVDIDAQAVEVTKLSLLLKVLEGENADAIARQMDFFNIRVLPDLGSNIKCGNSLIENDIYSQISFELSDEEEEKINPFDWQGFLRAATDKNGFDAIIGNPPYVLLQDANRQRTLESYYDSHYTVASFKRDLYHLFIERASQLLSRRGILSFIVPSNFLTNNYATALRKLMLENQQLETVTNLKGRVFQSASVDTCIFVLRRGGESKDLNFFEASASESGLKSPRITKIPYSRILADEAHLIVPASDADDTVLLKMAKVGRPLGQQAYVNFGKQLRDRKKFPSDVREIDEPTPPPGYALCYTGKDVEPYLARWSGLACKKSRTAKRGGCWDDSKHSGNPKLVCRQVGKHPVFGLDLNGYQCLNTIFMVNPFEESDPYYLLAVLNSSAIRFYWNKKFSDGRDTFPKIKGTYLKELPVVPYDERSTSHTNLVKWCHQIVTSYEKLNKARMATQKIRLRQKIDGLQKSIDDCVLEIYGVTIE